MKNLGIIGGLGPMATAYFLELIIRMTDVKTDQEHIRVYMQSLPDTPDRTAFICGKSDKDPLSFMAQAGKNLAEQGADFIAIPCVTAHYFYQELTKQIPIPVINLLSGLVTEIHEQKAKRVGLLATTGTIEAGLLQKQLNDEGIEVVIPSNRCQTMLMDIIYNQIKANRKIDIQQFYYICDELKEMKAEKLILGCTELSLINRSYFLNNSYVDMLNILAKNTVLYSGAPLKTDYLVT